MTSSRNFVFPLLDSTNLDLGMITIGVEGLGSRSATVFFWKIILLYISINFMMRSITWLLVIIYFYYFSFLLLLNRPWMWKLWVDLSTSRPLHKKVYANQKRGTKTCICQSRCSVMEYPNQNSAYAICQSEYAVQWQCRRSRMVHVKTLIGRFLPFYTSKPVCWGSVYAF